MKRIVTLALVFVFIIGFAALGEFHQFAKDNAIEEVLVPLPNKNINVSALWELQEVRDIVAGKIPFPEDGWRFGSGVDTVEDLAAFLTLVDSLPYVELVLGNISDITHARDTKTEPGVVMVSEQEGSHTWARIEYNMEVSNIPAEIEKVLKNTKAKRLDEVAQNEDGTLKIYAELVEKYSPGSRMYYRWYGELKGLFVRVSYHIAGEDTVNVSEFLADKKTIAISDVTEKPEARREESLEVSERTLEIISQRANEPFAAEGQKVIKVYYTDLVTQFAKENEIEDILDGWTSPPQYWEIGNQSVSKIAVLNKDGSFGGMTYPPLSDRDFYWQILNQLWHDSSLRNAFLGISIHKTYCLNAEPGPEGGFTLYYETNHGTYIYCKRREEAYLFPLEKFQSVMQTWCRHRESHPATGDDFSFSEIKHIEKYTVASSEFNPEFEENILLDSERSLMLKRYFTGCGIFIGLILLGVGIEIVIKKKKKQGK